MINILLVTSLSIFIIFIFFLIFLPEKLGHWVYSFATNAEAKAYKLKKVTVDIGEMKMSLYQNELSDRPTIIMLHGFSADKNMWPRFAKHFTKEFNVIIPDMAGHGDTGYQKEWNYGSAAQVERLIKLMDTLQIEKTHVIGNSMGGFISAHFALMYPKRILSIGLIDPAGVKSPKASDMEKMLTKGINPFEIFNRKDFDNFYAMTMAKPPWFPSFIFAAISKQYQQRREELMAMFKQFHQQNMLDTLLHKIEIPTLLLWGAKDRLIHVKSVDVWKKEIKHIEIKVWPNIGHMPMLEIPKESAKIYRDFLKKQTI